MRIIPKGPKIDIAGADKKDVLAALEEVVELIRKHPDALDEAELGEVTFERLDSGFSMDLVHRS